MDMTVERAFSLGSGKVTILVEPGRIRLPTALLDMHWHDAERLAVELRELAMTARVLKDLQDKLVDPAHVCAQCDKEILQGVVTVEVPGDSARRRHVKGSPGCVR